MLSLDVQEKRCPLWSLAAPGMYLLAALAAVRSVVVDRADVGVAGILLAVGLIPAFVVPVVFTTRRSRLAMTDDGLTINGHLTKIDDVRIERADRGSAILHFVIRSGETRTFIAPLYKDAQRLLAMLPPASAPSMALAA